MYQFEKTGGARYGMVKASFPFAKLKVSKNKLELNISLLGNLQFRPADVTSIETYYVGPFTNGFRINHTVDAYKQLVVFRCNTSAEEFFEQIKQTGFLNNKEALSPYEEMEFTAMQSKGGFAVKTSVAIAIVIIWNACLFPGIFDTFVKKQPVHIHQGFYLGLGFILILSIALAISEPIRRLVLKEGRTFKDVNRFVYFMILLSALMLIASLAMPTFPPLHK